MKTILFSQSIYSIIDWRISMERVKADSDALSQEAVYMAMILYDYFNTRGFYLIPKKLIQNQVEQESTKALNLLNEAKIKTLKNDIAKLQGFDCPYPEFTKEYQEAQFKKHPYEVYWGISQDDREMM